MGECDLLAAEGDFLVLVEVKTRRDSKFGAPEYAVDRRKREHLRRVAKYELKRRDFDNCRFDVIAIEAAPPQVEFRHIPSAFTGLE